MIAITGFPYNFGNMIFKQTTKLGLGCAWNPEEPFFVIIAYYDVNTMRDPPLTQEMWRQNVLRPTSGS